MRRNLNRLLIEAGYRLRRTAWQLEYWGGGHQDNPTPPNGWTCFHCGENFMNWQSAQRHFGEDVKGKALCQKS